MHESRALMLCRFCHPLSLRAEPNGRKGAPSYLDARAESLRQREAGETPHVPNSFPTS
jgi:hypothetical protein